MEGYFRENVGKTKGFILFYPQKNLNNRRGFLFFAQIMGKKTKSPHFTHKYFILAPALSHTN